MQLLVAKSRECTDVINHKVVAKSHVGGIKLTYNLIKPGVNFLGKRWGDKVLGEYIFFKPLAMHLDESKINTDVKKEKAKNLTSPITTWVLLESNFNDIVADKKHIRIKSIVRNTQLAKSLDRYINQIILEENSLEII